MRVIFLTLFQSEGTIFYIFFLLLVSDLALYSAYGTLMKERLFRQLNLSFLTSLSDTLNKKVSLAVCPDRFPLLFFHLNEWLPMKMMSFAYHDSIPLDADFFEIALKDHSSLHYLLWSLSKEVCGSDQEKKILFYNQRTELFSPFFSENQVSVFHFLMVKYNFDMIPVKEIEIPACEETWSRSFQV